MKTNLSIYRFVLVALLLPLVISIPNTDTHARLAYIEVGGPIISDTTWTLANSPYIVTSSIQVMVGVTLTIQPGVVVKFDSGRLLQVDGALVARGTAVNPITFTSNQPTPQPGDWANIYFTDTNVDATFDSNDNYISGSILEYCIVEYGGSNRGAIQTDKASPLISYCVVRENSNRGIYVGNNITPTVIRYNIINNNTVDSFYEGGGIYAYNSIMLGNTVTGNSAGYGGGIYASNSTISSNIVTGNSSRIGSGIYARDDSKVIDNTVTNNSSGNLGEGGGIFVIFDSTASGNTVIGNSASRNGGGIYADYNSTVSGNTVISNYTGGYGGGIYANRNSEVRGNTVTSNSAKQGGGGIYACENSTVISNTVTTNEIFATGQGSGIYTDRSNVLYNTIVGNTTISPTALIGGIAVAGSLNINYNNIYGNSNYDVLVLFSNDVDGTNNYWGTISEVDILAQVYDWYDNSSRGRLSYLPYLQDPDPNTPVSPPRNLQVNFTNENAILSWNAIPSTTTGYRYKVYYNTDVSGPPYNGTGLAQGSSPIDVDSVTNYTLSGLASNSTYYIAVTAYDNQGHESWYSNEVNSFRRVFLPLVLRN